MRIRWRGFELPSHVVVDEATKTGSYAKFMIEPFERGFGTTIGNSLRRVLLSSLEGVAVTSVKIEGAKHEFDALDGVYEDVADIILNIKQLRVRMTSDEPATMRIEVNRKGEVTGADISADADIEVVSKDLVICTLTESAPFVCEMTVSKGRGYATADENQVEDQEIGVIPVDSMFSPVLRVRYHVEEARVGQRIDYDRLVMEVWSDGTVAPEMALVEAGKILRKHLSPFVTLSEPGPRIAAGAHTAALPRGDAEMTAKLSIPISDLNLSVRAAHCLENEDIHTVGDLVSLTEEQLLQVRNFGRTSLEEVEEKLEQMGLSLCKSADAASVEAGEE